MQIIGSGLPGGPAVKTQCAVLVLGAALFGATAAYPVKNEVGLFLSATLRYRTRSEISRESCNVAYVRDPITCAVLEVVKGGEAAALRVSGRRWLFTPQARAKVNAAFLPFTTSEDMAFKLGGLVDRHLQAFLKEKLLVEEKDIPGRIRSLAALEAFFAYEGWHEEREVVSYGRAFGMYLHELYEKIETGNFRWMCNKLVLRFQLPVKRLRSVHANYGAGERSNESALDSELDQQLREYINGHPDIQNSQKARAIFKAREAALFYDLDPTMTMAEISNHLETNKLNHEVRDLQGTEQSFMRIGLAILRGWAWGGYENKLPLYNKGKTGGVITYTIKERRGVSSQTTVSGTSSRGLRLSRRTL
jgi:hypothetical protein